MKLKSSCDAGRLRSFVHFLERNLQGPSMVMKGASSSSAWCSLHPQHCPLEHLGLVTYSDGGVWTGVSHMMVQCLYMEGTSALPLIKVIYNDRQRKAEVILPLASRSSLFPCSGGTMYLQKACTDRTVVRKPAQTEASMRRITGCLHSGTLSVAVVNSSLINSLSSH